MVARSLGTRMTRSEPAVPPMPAMADSHPIHCVPTCSTSR